MKKIIISLLVSLLVVGVSGCGNKDMVDTVYSYDYALVTFPDGGCKKLEIKKWRDYEDGEQIQITATDGTVYLVNSFNCVLVKEG